MSCLAPVVLLVLVLTLNLYCSSGDVNSTDNINNTKDFAVLIIDSGDIHAQLHW